MLITYDISKSVLWPRPCRAINIEIFMAVACAYKKKVSNLGNEIHQKTLMPISNQTHPFWYVLLRGLKQA